jgi:integrase
MEVTKQIEWKSLKASSKYQQIGVAERFLDMTVSTGDRMTFGQMPIAGIRRGDVKKILGRFSEHPHAGEAVLRLLRKLCMVALDLEWIENDPTFRIRFRPELIGHRAWTDEELAQFAQRWPLASRERLGYALALYTGQRRSDVAAMTREAYDGNGIAVVQEKTGAPLWIPVHPELRAALEAAPTQGKWLMMTHAGDRFSVEGFGNFMAKAISGAELPDECRLHGLRKSAGRSLAEAGCTAHQIMAILGHKSLAEAQRYTKGADQRRLAQQAIDRWTAPKLSVVQGGK